MAWRTRDGQSTADVFGKSVLLARLQDLVSWGRRNSLWPLNFGLSCCYVEMATSITSAYDIARFGAEVVRGSPREADVMVVSGTVFVKAAPVIKQLYEQMLEPRWVISMGSCSNSGGMYDIYSVVQGVDKFLPVDVYMPGCPPPPHTFMECLLLLQEKVAHQRRPLSWLFGPQEVVQPVMPARRDLKRAERTRQTTAPSIDRLPRATLWPEVGVSPKAAQPASRPPLTLSFAAPAVRPSSPIVQDVARQFGTEAVSAQPTKDGITTVWVKPDRLQPVLHFLKAGVDRPFRMLYDLTAIDERERRHREGQPPADFTVVYRLLSLDRKEDLRVKVALAGERPFVPTVTALWPNANWYERELWDMFGIGVEGHPHLRRILMPTWWEGHPLRKEHPARATEMPPFRLPEGKQAAMQEQLQFRPEEWGLLRSREDADFLFVNLGPAHTGTHGVLRLVVQLAGEEIVTIVPDIGFHHRAAEKMAERQTWHTYIPYTDRVDYLQGVLNEFGYVLSVERLAGIEVPDRAKVIRIMLAELSRIASHLVWYGTFAQDVGALSPVFYMFNDRERIHSIIEAICGGRMHPNWFRIGGVAQDLPDGWEALVRQFLDYLPPRLDEYDKLVMANPIFKARTQGIGAHTLEEAIDWGVTGPNLRATGLAWDLRKVRPYGGYEAFDFEVPTAATGDCYDRATVRVEEMRQSLRIIRQCLDGMPAGPYKARHPLTTPPLKEHTRQDIETLIIHFLGTSWGPVLPPGEAEVPIEASKGMASYYLVSDGDTSAYRARVRTPSFPHIQMVPLLARGELLSDLLAILGSLDFVLSDVDR